MVVISELLVGAIIGELIPTAWGYISKKAVGRLSQSDMKEKLERLRKALPMIQAVVAMTEKDLLYVGELNLSLNSWLWQLRDSVDAANDFLDEIEYRKLDKEYRSESGGSGTCSRHLRLPKFLIRKCAFTVDPICEKLILIVKQLDDVAAHVGDFIQLTNYLENRNDTHLEIENMRIAGSLPVDDKIFGRDEEKEELIAWLLGTTEEGRSEHTKSVPVCSVVGIGGLGKTTLCQAIYHDSKVKEHFNITMWVDVSNVFDASVILSKIMESVLGRRVSPKQNLSVLQENLRTKLEKERYLLVLDDVWNDENRSQWENLIAPLKYGKAGSKILLTTRMGSVAKLVRDVMAGTDDHKHLDLKMLKNDDLTLLLYQHAFVGVNPKDWMDLQPIGKEIARRLGGVPLLAKVMGGVLSNSFDYTHWRRILDNDIMEVLKLGYHNLPVQLHACFRLCSIYPEDYEFRKDELVGVWISLGLIQPSASQRLEDVAEQYLNILVRKSLLEIKHGSYRMHGYVHYMARAVAKDECWGAANLDMRSIPLTTRHLFLRVEDLSTFQTLQPPPNLHMLIIKYWGDDSQFVSILDTVLTKSTNLRVLELWCPNVHEIPVTVGELIHLRHLFLCIGQTVVLTKHFRKLYNLQELHLDVGGIKEALRGQITNHKIEVPRAFSKLKKLKHLHVCYSLVFFHGIGKLISLQEIDTFTVKDEDGYKLSELMHMNELNGLLEIVDLENVKNCKHAKEVNLKEKKQLNSLILKWNRPSPGEKGRKETDFNLLTNLEPPSKLKELTVNGYEGMQQPDWMVSCLRHLVSITLMNCSHMIVHPSFEWPFLLKTIHLENLPKIKQLPPVPLSTERIEIHHVGLVYLPELYQCSESDSKITSSLSSLVIRGCANLKSLAKGLLQQQEYLTALEYLDITECDELIHLPPNGFSCFISLKRITLMFCKLLPWDSITGKVFPVSLMILKLSDIVGTSLSDLLSSFMFLSCLVLKQARMTSLPTQEVLGRLIGLETFFLYKCTELKSLGGLNAVISLTELRIISCPKLEVVAFKTRTHENCSISTNGLRNLEGLLIRDCEILASVENLCALFSLKWLRIEDCPKLRRIKFMTSEGSSSEMTHACRKTSRKLKLVEIYNCAKLTSLEFLQGFSSIKELYVSDCRKLVALAINQSAPSDSEHNTSSTNEKNLLVDEIDIDDPSLLLLAPVRNLTSVKKLNINDCSKRCSLPEDFLMQNKNSLQSLWLKKLYLLDSLPSNIKDLSRLHFLQLRETGNIRSLPELPLSLRNLDIRGCDPELENQYCRNTGPKWQHIAHITDVYISSW
jgi:NB-ARC domain/Rx N-terminal domain